MTTITEINGQKATVSYDSKIEMLRGAFVGLTSGAEVYAEDAVKLGE